MPHYDLDLVERVNAAIRSVNVRFGPNALAIMRADGSVPLSQGESWHMALAVIDELAEDAAVRPPGAQELPCSAAFLFRPHAGHAWEPQPGMTPVWCLGNTGPTHSCGNCEDIDPNTCLMNRGDADALLAASELEGAHARLLAACDANLTGDDDGEQR